MILVCASKVKNKIKPPPQTIHYMYMCILAVSMCIIDTLFLEGGTLFRNPPEINPNTCKTPFVLQRAFRKNTKQKGASFSGRIIS